MTEKTDSKVCETAWVSVSDLMDRLKKEFIWSEDVSL